MHFEKQGNYGKAKFRISGISGISGKTGIAGISGKTGISGISGKLGASGEERFDPRLHQRVYLRLQFAALRGIGEDLGGDAATFRRLGNELVRHVVGVYRLHAEFV